MSCFLVRVKDGVKYTHPIRTAEEYRKVRGSERQKETLLAARGGDMDAKKRLEQFCYSCIPDGRLKGCKTLSKSVGMDIDFSKDDPDYERKMAEVPQMILAKREEAGLLMLERSATKGYHMVFRRREGMSQEENLKWASALLGVEYDKGAKDLTRVFFTTTDSEEDLLYLDDALFDNEPWAVQPSTAEEEEAEEPVVVDLSAFSDLKYEGIPYADIVKTWWKFYNNGHEPVQSNRNTLTFELAVNLRHICGFSRELLDQVIPCYDGFPEREKLECIDSALKERRGPMPVRLKTVLAAVRNENAAKPEVVEVVDELTQQDELYHYNNLPKAARPMGVTDSIEAVGPALTMATIAAITPAIGALATHVKLDVHDKVNYLNIISYISGDSASGKGQLDPVVECWLSEVRMQDDMYIQQEDEWRAKKKSAKNAKNQPEEPKLPVRFITLNNTVANVAERLANTQGKHAFSFTPEADTVAQKWRSSISDFSVMLRQAYDASRYDREAKSADAVTVHIPSLKWNVVMCGTPDALYRVVTNYTDGFQNRLALASTPDNTYSPLGAKTNQLTDLQAENIRQVAHLLPLMDGTLVLPKLEKQSRQWVEGVRLDAMKNDDRVMARQRFRICVTAQRMVCCLMLCKVAEQLIKDHGNAGAEKRLRQNPGLFIDMMVKAQTPAMMQAYDLIADSLLDTALLFFRDKLETAYVSADYSDGKVKPRAKSGKNDTIFERLDTIFTREQLMQVTLMVKPGAKDNTVRQILKNWTKQGLIERQEDGRFHKTK